MMDIQVVKVGEDSYEAAVTDEGRLVWTSDGPASAAAIMKRLSSEVGRHQVDIASSFEQADPDRFGVHSQKLANIAKEILERDKPSSSGQSALKNMIEGWLLHQKNGK